MRKSLLRHGLLCGSLVMLSGCYSNGKFHSPTWNDMAWWRKDRSPDTSLAAAPSTGGRPSDEALADRNSPGARATAAPPYEGATASYDQPPGGDSRYPGANYAGGGYPNTGYPNVPSSPSGGTSWSANGDAAASVASNPYAKGGAGGYGAGGYDTGTRYDTRPADHAQTTPYDGSYEGGRNSYSGGNGYKTATPSGANSRDYGNNYGGGNYGGNTSAGGGSTTPAGPRDNPYYGDDEPTSSGGSQYGEDRYSTGNRYESPERYVPPANRGASNEKFTPPNYATNDDAARRYNSEGYRDMTGDRYQTDDRYPTDRGGETAAKNTPADASGARTADVRNADASRGNAYEPGVTGYQPNGVPSYVAPYQPGGTSRYEPAGGASGNASATGGSDYRTNPHMDSAPGDRYRDTPVDSRDGAARY